MIDKLLLFPYWLSLKVRHLLYDKGVKKVSEAEVPTICIGNVTVGGTGKTPHTEMLLRTLLADNELSRKSIAVLSRGYKRKLKGFQQVVLNGSASEYILELVIVTTGSSTFFLIFTCSILTLVFTLTASQLSFASTWK